ncbi:MAG: hypothetical protein ACI9VR_000634 [Cognaticolwellia sp.]|jgi:hypothetical protein
MAKVHNPYASPESAPESTVALLDQRRSTHHSRVQWLGLWNAFCGVAGLLLTAFVALAATNVRPVGLLLWFLFWVARTLAGTGMLKRKLWRRWLGVGVH